MVFLRKANASAHLYSIDQRRRYVCLRNDFETSGQKNLSAIKRNAGSIENKRVLIEIYIRKCKNKKMRKKVEEKALLATIDIKGLKPKLGSDGFL